MWFSLKHAVTCNQQRVLLWVVFRAWKYYLSNVASPTKSIIEYPPQHFTNNCPGNARAVLSCGEFNILCTYYLDQQGFGESKGCNKGSSIHPQQGMIDTQIWQPNNDL